MLLKAPPKVPSFIEVFQLVAVLTKGSRWERAVSAQLTHIDAGFEAMVKLPAVAAGQAAKDAAATLQSGCSCAWTAMSA